MGWKLTIIIIIIITTTTTTTGTTTTTIIVIMIISIIHLAYMQLLARYQQMKYNNNNKVLRQKIWRRQHILKPANLSKLVVIPEARIVQRCISVLINCIDVGLVLKQLQQKHHSTVLYALQVQCFRNMQ